MKTFLFSFSFMLFTYSSVSQITTSRKKNVEKELSLSYVVVYPDEFLPSLECSVRKIIAPAFHVGAGVSAIYFRYRERIYVPIFADANIYFGKTKRWGLNVQAGYGFYKYNWDNGNAFVREKGSYYFSFGPKYSFSVKNKKLNCSVNLADPATNKNLYIDNTKQNTNTTVNNTGINIKLGISF